MSEPTIHLWRYLIPSSGLEGWGLFLIASDGYFSCVSDYGNYAYRWNAFGDRDFREFLIGLNADYLIGKIAPEQRYDGPLTLGHVKKYIDELHEKKNISVHRMKEELELIGKTSLENEFAFFEWTQDTSLDEPQSFYSTSHSSDVHNFCKHLWPRFVEVLKKDLELGAAAAFLARSQMGGNTKETP
jgi:hypothetical protein